ncbi:hypothetical protein GcM3_212007 [Golovinomyces cichoracearum]|uniref:Uncharacterized protein n=1 Tax=Golovinomyces cichoracearum TaxID=62708 RepID=A0A420H9G5_9PEZI|nr:hypothetical protein GcM3_212007 [Golovinomyces cichoracearum]
MEEILSKLCEFTSSLLCDIANWGDAIEQLPSRSQLVSEKLAEYGIIVNTTKTNLYFRKGVLLDLFISGNGIKAVLFKVATIRDCPMPITITKICRLTGTIFPAIEEEAEVSNQPENKQLKTFMSLIPWIFKQFSIS